MPRSTGTKAKASATARCDCGELKPADGDQEITSDMTPEQVLSQVQLICNDNPGAFFFRYNRKLYLRAVV